MCTVTYIQRLSATDPSGSARPFENGAVLSPAPCVIGSVCIQVRSYQFLQDFIPLQAGDQAARGVVIGDICRFPGYEIADQLGDGIISLGLQRLVDILQDVMRLNAELSSFANELSNEIVR